MKAMKLPLLSAALLAFSGLTVQAQTTQTETPAGVPPAETSDRTPQAKTPTPPSQIDSVPAKSGSAGDMKNAAGSADSAPKGPAAEPGATSDRTPGDSAAQAAGDKSVGDKKDMPAPAAQP